MGRDLWPDVDEAPENVSIHAPAWGATGNGVTDGILAEVSIHAPAWGATHGPVFSGKTPFVSIHAPTRGATTVDPLAFPRTG